MIIGCGMSSNTSNMNEIEVIIKMLSDERLCDEAYSKLITVGLPAVPYLIENSSNQRIFKGNKVYNPASSLLVERPTVGIVSLYLIECIIFNSETPYLAPLIVSSKEVHKHSNGELPKTKDHIVQEATGYYKEWWSKVKNLEKSQIKRVSPLSHSSLRWW